MPHQPRWADQSRIAMGYERLDLPSRTRQRRSILGRRQNLAGAESHPVCGKIQNADAANGRRERLPRAAQSDARELVGPSTVEDPEPSYCVPGRESLDIAR